MGTGPLGLGILPRVQRAFKPTKRHHKRLVALPARYHTNKPLRIFKPATGIGKHRGHDLWAYGRRMYRTRSKGKIYRNKADALRDANYWFGTGGAVYYEEI